MRYDYQNKEKENAKKYQGASNFNINDGEVHDHVGINDETSCYPTIIMIYNLCITTFIKGSYNEIPDLKNDSDVIQIEIDDNQYTNIRYAYFSRTPGVIPALTQNLFAVKNNADEEKKKILARADKDSAANKELVKQLEI